MELTRPYWKEARAAIQKLVASDSAHKDNKTIFMNISEVETHLPARIGDYTDFYSSYNHAYNVGCIIRGPNNAIQPNWMHLPVGYHGRASTVVNTGTPIRRPRGQTKPPTAEKPGFVDCKRLDFELEVGAFVGGPANKLGQPIKVDEANDRIFGLVLMNDWSARDIQVWEYVPLGPFNAKNFATTISPWIVTLEALDRFRVDLPEQDPKPFKYLDEKKHQSFDINLDTFIQPEGKSETRVCRSNFKYLYWSVTQ